MCITQRENAYKLPVAKIAQALIFCLFGICSFAMTGIGSTKVKTSMTMFRIESAMYFVNWSIHMAVGTRLRLQLAVIGMQPKILIRS